LPGFFIFTKNRPDESPAFFLSEKHPASPGSDHRPPMALIRKLHVGQTRRRPSSETSRRTALALKVRRGRPKAGETLVLPGVPGGRVGSCRVFLFSPRIGRTKVRLFFLPFYPSNSTLLQPHPEGSIGFRCTLKRPAPPCCRRRSRPPCRPAPLSCLSR